MEQRKISTGKSALPLFVLLRESARLRLFLVSVLILLVAAALVCGVIGLVCLFLVNCGLFA
jgi:hypothetical protein